MSSFASSDPRDDRCDATGNLWQHQFYGPNDPPLYRTGGVAHQPFFGEAGPVPAPCNSAEPSPADPVGYATEWQSSPTVVPVPVRPPQSAELLRATAELYFDDRHRRLPVPAPKEPASRARVDRLEAEYAAVAAGPAVEADGAGGRDTPDGRGADHAAEKLVGGRPAWMAPSVRLQAVVVGVVAGLGGAIFLFLIGRQSAAECFPAGRAGGGRRPAGSFGSRGATRNVKVR